MGKLRGIKRALLLAFVGLTLSPSPGGAQTIVQEEINSLVKAAKAEGEVLFYSSSPEGTAKRVADGFASKYGIKAGFIRLAGVAVLQRFSSEAEAGTFAADFLVYGSGAREFASDAMKKGWVESASTAGIPATRNGDYPMRFLSNIAVVNLAPWGIGYNTDKVKGGDIPRDWPDLLHVRFKGQINVPDPRSADSYSDFWSAVLDKYGEQFFIKLREQNLRFYGSGVPATNGLAAGESLIVIPSVGTTIGSMTSKGAPVANAYPSWTTGVETSIILTTRTKAKHPNAARLFAHYAMSRDGNALFSQDPGIQSVYDITGLPKDYEAPKPGSVGRRDLFAKLLGMQ